MRKDKDENGMLSHIHSHEAYRSRELGILEHSLLDGDMFLQVRKVFPIVISSLLYSIVAEKSEMILL